MGFTQHVHKEALEAFLRDDLRDQAAKDISLHLSYCPLCQEERDQLLFFNKVIEMREVYDQSGVLETQHIDEELLRRFWAGQIEDTEQLENISEHCIVCQKCHQKRHDAYLIMKTEVATNQIQAVFGFTFVTWLLASKRRLIGAFLSIVLIAVAVFLLGRKTSPNVQVVTRVNTSGSETVELADQAEHATGQRESSTPTKKNHTKQRSADVNKTRRKTVKPPNIENPIQMAQIIDLRAIPEEYGLRGRESITQVLFRITPARRHLTKLYIELPEKHKKGWYLVSIQEPIDLGTVTRSKAESADGMALPVYLDLRKLPASEYVLCITRKESPADGSEYLGHYPVLIGNSEDLQPRITK